MEKIGNLFSSFSNIEINKKEQLNIDDIVNGNKTDIELENDVFIEEKDNTFNSIMYYYFTSFKNKIINHTDNEVENVTTVMENIVL